MCYIPDVVNYCQVVLETIDGMLSGSMVPILYQRRTPHNYIIINQCDYYTYSSVCFKYRINFLMFLLTFQLYYCKGIVRLCFV